ncbi:MAG TPA: DNA-formamidopyrimidine glycosylase family protein [Galbitalea sp.]|jgi:formamidopyrimidine-DNA glycosylase
MPEGHSVHRIARQFALHFVGKAIAVSSPQGRFAAEATKIDGRVMTGATAVGKQMFLEFDNGLWLRVHLGIYGAWDFAGNFTADSTNPQGDILDSRAEDSLASMGAPRVTRLRMSEQEKLEPAAGSFPPDPIGAVRVRLLADDIVGDLRGPTACEVITPAEVQEDIDKLGPDPLVDSPKKGEERFVAAVRAKATPIGLLLMDQSVVSGIGNVYRAELLFRARLDPHKPGRDVPEETVRALWKDWTKLLKIGVKTGQMLTMDGLTKARYAAALANREDRHWVYHREGEPCRVCGTIIVMEMAAGRKLYYCPHDQV